MERLEIDRTVITPQTPRRAKLAFLGVRKDDETQARQPG